MWCGKFGEDGRSCKLYEFLDWESWIFILFLKAKNNQMSGKKRKYWNNLKNRYKLTIFNESTYEEIMHLRLSPLHVLTALSTLAVILIILTIILIAFTNLREFIPGYPDRQLRRQITQNALRVDSLLEEVQKKDRFLRSIQTILEEEKLDTSSMVSAQKDVKLVYDNSMLGASEEEARFREMVEKEEKYNLSLGHVSSSDDDFYHFFSPLEGVVTNHFDGTTRHYGVDLVAKQNSNVLSVLDGVVIFTDWTLKTGYVIQVQHNGNLVSVYKHNSVLLKKQGDHVRAGEAIAVLGNTGEETTGPHLHFELWQAGKALNPETFIKFK